MKTGATSLKARLGVVGVVTTALLGGLISVLTLGVGANGATQQPHAVVPTGSIYTATNPVRIADTRADSSFPDQGETLGPNSAIQVMMPNIVPENATAVVLNVTATNATQQSYFSVYPHGSTTKASNINIYPGLSSPNLVIVPLGANSVDIYNFSGHADAVVDLQGWFTPAGVGPTNGQFFPLEPNRIADTRGASGEPNEGATLGRGGVINVKVDGVGGVPASGVAAVEVNVTATNTTASSFFSVYPTPVSPSGTTPTFSNLNWVANETIANRVIVPVGADGDISIFNLSGNADAVVDVNGWFSDNTVAAGSGNLFTPLTPYRITDTRAGSDYPNAGQTLQPNSALTVQVTGTGGSAGIPAATSVNPVTAAVMNITEATSTQPSFLTVYPTDQGQPVTSDLNFIPYFVVANADIADLSASGQVNVYNFSGLTDVVVDVFGYFTPATPPSGNTIVLSPDSPSTPANGSSAITLSATVTDTSGNVSGDPVTFAILSTNDAACGKITGTGGSTTQPNGEVTGTTNSSGVVQVSYTPSITVGPCVVGAIESQTSATTTDTVTQTAPSGYQISVVAIPSTIPADGSSTSTVTATVTDNGSPVSGDPVMFSGATEQTGACSTTFPTGTVATGTSGQSQFTYTATTSTGQCTITAKESQGSMVATTVLTQTPTGNQVVVSPANNSLSEGQTEPLTVTVTNGGNPVANDVVTLSVPVTTCGQLSQTGSGLTTFDGVIMATTNASGVASGVTYTASDTAETCQINATEADHSESGVGNVTQSSSGNVIQLFAYPNSLPADGSSTSTVIATFTDNGVPVAAGTPVSFTGNTTTTGACGIAGTVPKTTAVNGQVTLNYKSTTVPGTCTVSATSGEVTGSVAITQTGLPVTNVTVTSNPSTALLVLGTTAQITASVTGAGGVPIGGQSMVFSMVSNGTLCACGSLSATNVTTGSNGQAQVTYTAPLIAPVLGSCTIVATDTSVTPNKAGQVSIMEIIPVPIGLG